TCASDRLDAFALDQVRFLPGRQQIVDSLTVAFIPQLQGDREAAVKESLRVRVQRFANGAFVASVRIESYADSSRADTQMINQCLHPRSRFFQIASKPGEAMVAQQRAVQTIAAQEIFGTVTNCDDSPLFYCAARIRIYAGVPRVEVGIIFLVLI